MTNKKSIPLELLEVIEPIAQENLDFIRLVKQSDTYYKFVEIDPNSPSYFEIFIDGTKKIANFTNGNYAVRWKPINATNQSRISQLDAKVMKEVFAKWIDLIRQIHDIPSVHDDNFLRQYSEYYFNEFRILDEDADIRPFNPQQQELIEVYLLSTKRSIEASSEVLPETFIKKITEEIEDVRSDLPLSTKSNVIRKITKIFGRLYMINKSLAKEIVNQSRKQLVKELINLGIKYSSRILELLN